MKRKRKLYKSFFIIFILFTMASFVFLVIDRGIKPTVIAMSEAQVRYIAIKAMNNAVKKVLNSDIKYTDLINVMTDREGKISLIQANTIKMNALASETSSVAQEEIRSMGAEGIYIPLGSIFNSKILAGLGPRLKVTIIPIGSVSIDFATEFENAGINQTRHKIYMVMEANVRIVVPLGSDTASVKARIPITETIIVGDVPDYYINVGEGGKDDILNLVPGP
ncbi:sporulation protein YunB [Caldicoprobacter guelmensis]|uniref:sporulation protein YunB n=1 Tax=Caldicoprobacter guelmensis TaxID=1170224 RepID=UPI00195893CD|nr:sporulation protein YunB [Caldicoprobacter guelmensis]MBM7581362.1 sporulation protein YunB [Caldicoprobacter guelmensis]